jgi:hypothetical protein
MGLISCPECEYYDFLSFELNIIVIKKAFDATEEEFLHLVKRALPARPQIASAFSWVMLSCWCYFK